jgi:hypothetical protein
MNKQQFEKDPTMSFTVDNAEDHDNYPMVTLLKSEDPSDDKNLLVVARSS